MVFPDCSCNFNGVWMKWSTDYDSLDAGNFFLWEQMLLKPFKVIVRPVNVVLPRTSQLQTQQTAQHGWLETRYLTLKEDLLLAADHCFLTFSDTIRKVSTSPSFTTSVTFTLWPWTLRADPTAFTSSWNSTIIISTTDATAKVYLLHTVETCHMTYIHTSLSHWKLTIIFRLLLNPDCPLSAFQWLWISFYLDFINSCVALQRSSALCWLWCIICCWACTGYPLGQSAHSSWSNTVPDLKC